MPPAEGSSPMERRFRVRLDELRDDAEVHPGLLRGLVPRLEGFVRPFVAALGSDAQRQNATHYIRGLVSNLGGKTAEAIAYLHDRERQGLQKFIGQADWDPRPLLAQLARQVGPALPHGWVSGDDELGRSSWFRRQLQSRGECYLLAVPSNTSVRDLAAPDPPYPGHGRPPMAPFGRADRWAAAVPAGAWQAVEVRDGEKGPAVVHAARTPVQVRADNRASDVAELLVVFRERQADGTWKHDDLLSNAPL